MPSDTDTRVVDRNYHLKRADAARTMAAAARDAGARQAHQAMADEHSSRAAAPHRSGLKRVRE